MRMLLFLTAAFLGFLSGVTVDRLAVQMLAFQAIGPNYWGLYTLHADLANGKVLYPLLAIGGYLLSIIAAFLVYKDKQHPELHPYRFTLPQCYPQLAWHALLRPRRIYSAFHHISTIIRS